MNRAAVVSAQAAFGLAALFSIAASNGCSKPKPATPGGVRLEEVSASFASAGLRADGFAPADAARFGATRCVAGRVESVDTLVCEYGTPEALALGKKASERWAGDALTSAVLGNGRTLLAVADRAHSDPNGRTIHKITRAFTATR